MTRAFTSALGRGRTLLYDLVIRLLTRERYWRSLLLEQVALRDGERILDLGLWDGHIRSYAESPLAGCSHLRHCSWQAEARAI